MESSLRAQRHIVPDALTPMIASAKFRLDAFIAACLRSEKFKALPTGEILNVAYNHTRQPRVVRARVTPNGYLRCGLKLPGERIREVLVHRVVAIAFYGLPASPSFEVDHLNGIKLDNRPENLQWVDRSENQLRAYAMGLRDIPAICGKGSQSQRAKVSDEDVIAIRARFANGEKQKDLAASYGLTQPSISLIVNRKNWKHLTEDKAQ